MAVRGVFSFFLKTNKYAYSSNTFIPNTSYASESPGATYECPIAIYLYYILYVVCIWRIARVREAPEQLWLAIGYQIGGWNTILHHSVWN